MRVRLSTKWMRKKAAFAAATAAGVYRSTAPSQPPIEEQDFTEYNFDKIGGLFGKLYSN